MGLSRWGVDSQLSAKEYEARFGEKRTARRITTHAGIAFAVKQLNGAYKIWRMDQLLGTVMKHSRPSIWVANLASGEHLISNSSMKWCVERMQVAVPVSDSITDIETKRYAEQLVRKLGAAEARIETEGPARKAVEQCIKELCP